MHTDAHAAESANAINALAFTVGHDIFFGPNQFVPTSSSGKRLIAHELAHTIQQQSGPHGRLQRQIGSRSQETLEEAGKETFPVLLSGGTTVRLVVDPTTPQSFKIRSGLIPHRFTLRSVNKWSPLQRRQSGSVINPASLALFKINHCLSLNTSGANEDHMKLLAPFRGEPLHVILTKAMEQNPRLGMDIVGNCAIEGTVDSEGKVTVPYGFADWNPTDFLGFTKQRAQTTKKAYFGDLPNVQTFGIFDIVMTDPATGKKMKNPTTGRVMPMPAYVATRYPDEDYTGVTILLRIRVGKRVGVRSRF